MKKQEAINLLKAFFNAKEIPIDELNEDNNYFQIQLETEIVAFNYRLNEDAFTVSSLIYQFHDQPKPQVLNAIELEAEKEMYYQIQYEPENKTLYVTKTYTTNVSEELFIKEVDEIISTSKKWSSETLDHIASKVFHPEEIN